MNDPFEALAAMKVALEEGLALLDGASVDDTAGLDSLARVTASIVAGPNPATLRAAVPEERLEEFVGAGECHAGIEGGTSDDPPEVVLRLGVKGPDKAKVARFGPELVPLVTSGPPGVTGFAGGRPKAQEIIGYWPALVTKERVPTQVTVFES